MAEQTSTGYFQNPYKFNGKSQRSEDPDPSGQLDTETGLYYYGARYYDPRGSLWLSVDPMMEKNYNLVPYVYCGNNPASMIDPDGLDGIAVVDKEKRTITVNQIFYYDKTDKNLSQQAITQDRSIIGGPMDGTTFTAETTLAIRNGFGAKTWTVTDADGNEWTLSHQASFIGLDGGDALASAIESDPTANILTYDAELQYAGLWNPKNRTLSIGANRRIGEGSSGSTTIHEIGHSWGLPHENMMPKSPLYNQEDNGANAPANVTNGIMSCSQKRGIQTHEIQYGAGRILNTANSNNSNSVKIHVSGSKLPHKVIEQ